MTLLVEMILLLGSARAPRAGGGALAIADFVSLTDLMRVAACESFRRGRRNVHARARALPG